MSVTGTISSAKVTGSVVTRHSFQNAYVGGNEIDEDATRGPVKWTAAETPTAKGELNCDPVTGRPQFFQGGQARLGASLDDGVALPLTTKGDIVARSAASNDRVPVGTDGQVLTANAAAAQGVDWQDPSGAVHDLGGAQHNADTLANLNSKVSDATLIDTGDSRLSDSRTPTGSASGDLSGSYPGPTVTDLLKTKVTGADTTPALLGAKVQAGANMTINTLNAGGNEILEFVAAGGGGGGILYATQVIGTSVGGRHSAGEVDQLCDGTDDFVQLQAAHDALPLDGGIIRILGGPYTQGNTTVTFTKPVIIIGDGWESTIWTTPPTNITAITLTTSGKFEISHMKLIQGGNFSDIVGIDLGSSLPQHKIHDCVFQSTQVNGWNAISVGSAIDVRIYNNIFTGTAISSGLISLNAAENIWIERNRFSGLVLAIRSNGVTIDLHVLNNKAIDTEGFFEQASSSALDVVIAGNQIRRSSLGGGPAIIVRTNDCQVLNNQITNHATGIKLASTMVRADFIGNKIDSCTSPIDLQVLSHNHLTFRGNRIILSSGELAQTSAQVFINANGNQGRSNFEENSFQNPSRRKFNDTAAFSLFEWDIQQRGIVHLEAIVISRSNGGTDGLMAVFEQVLTAYRVQSGNAVILNNENRKTVRQNGATFSFWDVSDNTARLRCAAATNASTNFSATIKILSSGIENLHI